MSGVWLLAGSGCLGLALLGVSVLTVRRVLRPESWWGSHDLRVTLVALAAIGVFAVVAGWLFASDPLSPKGDVLRTGGLAAGSIVALHALWLNDRRRRVEEQRQELENRRAEHDRERNAEERFLKSVELLGHDADQVRVGALHALAGLARSRPSYTQTVLDVLCSYLRRPIAHPKYHSPNPTGGDTWTAAQVFDASRKRQVRLTAQRLISDLLPHVDEADAEHYDLDLTGATLEYLDLSQRRVGVITMRAARLHESTALHGMWVHGPIWLTAAEGHGRLRVDGTVFEDKAWFSGFCTSGPAVFDRARFEGPTKFTGADFRDGLTLTDTRFAEPPDLAETVIDGERGLPTAADQPTRT